MTRLLTDANCAAINRKINQCGIHFAWITSFLGGVSPAGFFLEISFLGTETKPWESGSCPFRDLVLRCLDRASGHRNCLSGQDPVNPILRGTWAGTPKTKNKFERTTRVLCEVFRDLFYLQYSRNDTHETKMCIL